MSFKTPSAPEREPLPIEEEEMATHQESIPVPHLGGTRRISLRWISPAIDMVTQEAPDTTPGKK